MDPQQRQLLERGYVALHTSGWSKRSMLGAIIAVGVGQWYRGDLLIVGPVPEGETSGAVFESYIRQSVADADPAVLNHSGASIPLRWVVDDRFEGSELAVVSLTESPASE